MENKKEMLGISEFQTYLFNSGDNFNAYEFLGCHKVKIDGREGFRFAVWAPNAKSVKVACDANGWTGDGKELELFGKTGVWIGFFTDIKHGDIYKYAITAPDDTVYLRSDPYAVRCELRPETASEAYELEPFKWSDKVWLNRRSKKDSIHSPMNIYECHAGSWRIHEDGSFYNYDELADELIPYLVDMGYTHIEFMPLTEYPFDGSWGYQVTGYFAATSRYGTPEQLKSLVNKCHKAGIAVIMDWVPAHFPRDGHGLRLFDGTPCYEYADWREGEHKDWGTMVFDFAKGEVISFLTSSAYYWASEYHIDGLRVDAVSSMLYRDYSRNDGEWIANKYGGNGNLEAVDLLRKINRIMGSEMPGFLMIAEESTAWPLVTAPPENDGLGFNFKWNMGWMNDTLRYVSMDPYFRKDNHSLLTFLMMYAFSENFILPLSHDEVVHGKKSLIDKMYGPYEEKFRAYKTFLTYYMTMPGKKLMFMGGEIGQFLEWRFDDQLEWNVLDIEAHKQLHEYIKTLNHMYRESKALWELEQSWDGFKWINDADSENSVVSYIRMGKKAEDTLVVAANFTPLDRQNYKLGVPYEGEYEVILHSNSTEYGGTRRINRMVYHTQKQQFSDMDYTLSVPIDGSSAMILKRRPTKEAPSKIKKVKK
ncbi:MAG: 1,4-alpha-glucan branching protein GlgB [Candidatus Ornithomonoglobus sp.]